MPAVKRRPITTRQRQVLILLSEGLSSAGIGRRLGISEETVAMHLRLAYARLGARGGAHAVRICFERGIFEVTR
jgi:DNA-binding CsgD family transcriptional regulator